ncbi:RES family NAD+ phosphorylase [Amphibiibacter pelophylacis]|uniref:RES family NAD+ phosphorylase n=1 Tax=Amphibiibacter pelophylacis TaxID=1799477 RepID=A0ACC6NZH1_9BURK
MGVLDGASLCDLDQDLARNIVSLRESQDLFDDLSDSPADWRIAQQAEHQARPRSHVSPQPVIHRPFEEAAWMGAVQWPFDHPGASRFSDGQFGVWYGSDTVETTIYETVHHWANGFLADAGLQQHSVQAERKVYLVRCTALLADLRRTAEPGLGILDRRDYSLSQALGARLHREGHPGLLVRSARRSAAWNSGWNAAILHPDRLSDPRVACFLSYQLDGGRVTVTRGRDSAPWVLDLGDLPG